MTVEPNIYPSVYYRDAAAAIEWLSSAFGFEKRLVVPGEDGTIVHSELSLGPGFIMVGTAVDDRREKSPLDVNCETGGIYVRVDDVAGHYERPKAASATVIQELEAKEYGGSGFSVRDPEGHYWSVGDYRLGAYEEAAQR
jgi:uncharacterized glyoxalase superfamily protein PhnB